MKNYNLIDKDLWDAARWRETAFLVTADLDAQPGIGLMFEDYPAALKIFQGWRELFGEADRRDLLRVSILHGKSPKGRVGYTIHLTTDPEAIPPSEGTNPEYVVTGSRYWFKETRGSNESLDWFRASFEKHKMYFIVPLPMKPTGDMDVYMKHLLGKARIHVREFSSIPADDIDAVALGA